MKKIYNLLLFMVISASLHAQTYFTYSEDFESYAVGDYIGVESEQWTTWSGVTGGAEDAQINSDQANSGSNSIFFDAIGAQGPQDVVLLFGGLQTSDLFNFSAYFYVPSGNSAYFNFQGTETIGETWAIDVYMNNDGSLTVSNSGTNRVLTTFPQDQWFKVEFDINLTLNNWRFLIDDVEEGSWVNSVNAVAMADFYPATASDLFYIDDVTVSLEEYVVPNLNAQLQDISIGAIGVVGQEKYPTVTVSNAGLTEITDFDINLQYDGNSFDVSVNDVNLASFENMSILIPNAITLAEGETDLQATLSNVNGLAEDDVPEDDSKTESTQAATPAPYKVVIAEEGTGTWCQWCPRGTVAMDFMAENYDGYYLGIAVHNGDPMVVSEYDASIGFTAFPGAKVDRGAVIDPAAIEIDFINNIGIEPHAAITAGAAWSDGMLDVSLSYDVSTEIVGDWRVLCVLTEDSVTGTTSGYSQVNAYSGGANGPMGGFEFLPSPVPYSQMHYNHVARATIPGADGESYAFPDDAQPGETKVFNFSFPMNEDWNTDNMHIIGMLIDPNGQINNGGGASIDEALANGFVEGEMVLGLEEFAFNLPEIVVYPNPASEQMFIETQIFDAQNMRLQLMDATGKTVYSENLGTRSGNQRITVPTNHLDAGVYFLQVSIGNKQSTQKVMVQ